MSDRPFAHVLGALPGAPACATCSRRPQVAIELEGDVLFTGACGPCGEARAAGLERWRLERERRERQSAELAQRDRQGLPKVGMKGGAFG